MIGTVFIIIGITILGLGVFLLMKSENKKAIINAKVETNLKTIKIGNETGEEEISKIAKDFDNETKKQELKNLIKLAAADGVLTNNEKEIIIKKAEGLNINPENLEKALANELQKKLNDPETKIIDKQKERGDLFEALIASKFNKNYFTLKNWAGDKYSNGIYAETTIQPDLQLSFKLRGIEHNFAVECKYRSSYYKNGIEWAKQTQFNNYRKFEQDYNMPVFVAIGIGGNPNNPEELFIIPLNNIKDTFLHNNFLTKYKKLNFQQNNFYFNHNNNKLS
ncbi:MAG: hypothetical protein B6I20_04630 [Bacteroidetes bacterium 4572_117]|nr:MAG: hypothetical protein B6I20_04630 [Bacteroidetes bacterium 4572_117]